MKQFIIMILGLIMIFCPVTHHATSNSNHHLDISEFAVKGVNPASSPDDILRLFGKPALLKKSARHDDLGPADIEKWIYDGIRIELVHWQSGPEKKPGHIERFISPTPNRQRKVAFESEIP